MFLPLTFLSHGFVLFLTFTIWTFSVIRDIFGSYCFPWKKKRVELKSFTLFILFPSVIDFRLSSNTSETRADEVTITWSFLRKTLDQDMQRDWYGLTAGVFRGHLQWWDEFCPDVIKSAINDHSEHSKWKIIIYFFYPLFMLHIIICFI